MTSPFIEFDLMLDLHQDGGKIVLLVMDGLGGLPATPGGKTELETAHTPNLDRLAADGSLGPEHPDPCRRRTGERPGSSELVRLRSCALHDRTGRIGVTGNRIPITGQRCGGARQFRHGRWRRPDHGPAGGAHLNGGVHPVDCQAAVGPAPGCSKTVRCSSSQCRSIASFSCCGARGWEAR